MVVPANGRRSAQVINFPDWRYMSLSGWQKKFVADRSKRKILNAGRGAGKSVALVIDALIDAHELFAERPDTFLRPGPRVIVAFVAPNHQNQRDLWAAIKSWTPKLKGKTRDGEKMRHVDEKTKTLWLYGQSRGIEIRLLSAWTPNGMRGGSVDIMVLDEWAFCGYSIRKQKNVAGLGKSGDEVWDSILEKMVNRAFCFGKVTIASTPFSNYFDDWCHSALTGEGDFKKWSYHYATAFDNDFLTEEQKEEIADEEHKHPYKFRQERMAELHVVFPRFSATDYAYSNELINSVLIEALPGPSKGPYAAAIDISWLGSDWLCVVVVDLTTNIIVHVELHQKTDIHDIMRIFERVHNTWKIAPGKMGYDSTGEGRSISKLLPKQWECEPVFFYDSQKPGLVNNVVLRMQQGALLIPDPETFDFDTLPRQGLVEEQDRKANFAQAVAELKDYRRREDSLPSGDKRVKFMKGDIINRDDTVDALSVLGHVMPSLAMIPKSDKTKEKLANAFKNVYGGGGGARRRNRGRAA